MKRHASVGLHGLRTAVAVANALMAAIVSWRVMLFVSILPFLWTNNATEEPACQLALR